MRKILTDFTEDKAIPQMERAELMILSCLSHGLSTKETAEQLNYGQETIRKYMRISAGKLHAKNYTETVANAIRLKLIK